MKESAQAFDPKLEPLLAQYIRGAEGSQEVLHDALLERSLDPLPTSDDAVTRLERGLSRLAMDRQIAIVLGVVRRFVPRFDEAMPDRAGELTEALALLAGGTRDDSAREEMRQRAFTAWNDCGRRKTSADATRTAWAVWMLLRDMPLLALKAVRAVDPKELDAQVDIVARALGG